MTVTTSAPSEVAVEALVAALVDARFRLQEREAGRARLRVGSWLRQLVYDPLDLDPFVPKRFHHWGCSATVDLETLDTAPPTQVRVQMHKVWESELAAPLVLRAVDAAMQTLYAAGHHVEVSEVFEGP